MKMCSKCLNNKEKTEFYKHKGYQDGLRSICRDCHKTYVRFWEKSNKNKYISYICKWMKANKEKVKVYQDKQRKLSPWKHAAKTRKRQVAKIKRTPGWLTFDHLKQISSFYKKAAIMSKENNTKFHVDHIIPLQGKNVSGLHVPWNLQVIPAKDNLAKGNK